MQLLEEKIRQAARGRISMSAPQGGSGGFRPESAAAAVATSGVTQRGATEEGGLSNISEFVAMGSREEQLYQVGSSLLWDETWMMYTFFVSAAAVAVFV